MVFSWLLIYYIIYRKKTIRGLALLKVRPFFIRRQRKKMIINPIKKRREEKGLTQVDLALMLKVSQMYISHFETGGLAPSKSHIKKIAEILGISLETLNKELHQFYEARRRELEKKMERAKNST